LRIDVKTVKGKHYLQVVDKNGCLHHIGCADDFDSWLLSLVIWSRERLKEHKELFESIMVKASKYIELDEEKNKLISDVWYWYSYVDRRVACLKSIKLPYTWPYYDYVVENAGRRRLRLRVTEWGAELQKRLDEVYAKQKRAERKKRAHVRA